MRTRGRRIETRTATIELVAERSIEVRYRADAQYTTTAIERDRKARWKLAHGTPHLVLMVLPPGMDVHVPSMNQDHFRVDSDARIIQALAVVAESDSMNAAMKFYFRYYSQAFEVRVFNDEADARAWLKEVLAAATVQ